MAIGFNREFVKAVKEGVKTSTIRKHFNGKIGDKIEAYNADLFLPSFTNRSKSFGYIKITQILYIRFDEIDKEVARTEGYLHEDLLKETLYEIYDEIKPSTLLYYIQFEFIPLEQEDDTDESAE